jgi:hypothetical protein
MLSSGIMFHPNSSFGFGNAIIMEDTGLDFLDGADLDDYEDDEDYEGEGNSSF